jgi:hypothetical protein
LRLLANPLRLALDVSHHLLTGPTAPTKEPARLPADALELRWGSRNIFEKLATGGTRLSDGRLDRLFDTFGRGRFLLLAPADEQNNSSQNRRREAGTGDDLHVG